MTTPDHAYFESLKNICVHIKNSSDQATFLRHPEEAEALLALLAVVKNIRDAQRARVGNLMIPKSERRDWKSIEA